MCVIFKTTRSGITRAVAIGCGIAEGVRVAVGSDASVGEGGKGVSVGEGGKGVSVGEGGKGVSVGEGGKGVSVGEGVSVGKGVSVGEGGKGVSVGEGGKSVSVGDDCSCTSFVARAVGVLSTAVLAGTKVGLAAERVAKAADSSSSTEVKNKLVQPVVSSSAASNKRGR